MRRYTYCTHAGSAHTHTHVCTQPQRGRNDQQNLCRPLKMMFEIDWRRSIAIRRNLDSLYQFNSCLRSEEVRWEATRSISIKSRGLVRCYLSERAGGWEYYECSAICVGGGAGWREANPFDLWVMSETSGGWISERQGHVQLQRVHRGRIQAQGWGFGCYGVLQGAFVSGDLVMDLNWKIN